MARAAHLPFLAFAGSHRTALRQWTAFPGQQAPRPAASTSPCSARPPSVVFSLIAQIGEQVDFLRFLPAEAAGSRTAWWLALLSARARLGDPGHR